MKGVRARGREAAGSRGGDCGQFKRRAPAMYEGHEGECKTLNIHLSSSQLSISSCLSPIHTHHLLKQVS